ncbi:MAG: TonB-dependent hemoglobin/transferrin/lactoferrin family receptor [Pseudomonadota bacterium]
MATQHRHWWALGLAAACTTAWAQDDGERLQETVIQAEPTISIATRSLGSEELVQQMTDTIEDTVRYIPGVQVNDSGNRFNDNGFNIRGLEGDFVAVTIDGVDQGETLNPPSFSPYGFFGSSRGAIEVETVKAIQVTKGPNSVSVGNGALAGAVTYVTKDPSDFLQPDGNDSAIAIKTGYDSRSDEMMVSAALANRAGRVESLFQATYRDGHEVEAHDSGDDINGSARGQADPFDREELALLAKVDFAVRDNHTLGLVWEKVQRDIDGTPLSREEGPTYFDFITDDLNDRDRIGISYDIDDAQLGFADEIAATFDYQYLHTQGITTFGFNSARTMEQFLRQEDRAFKQETYRVGLDLSKELTLGSLEHELTYGIEYETIEVNNELFDKRYVGLTMDSGERSFNVDGTWVPETDIDRFSLYLRDEVRFTDRVSGFAGVRVDSTEYSPEVDDRFPDPTGDTLFDADFTAWAGEIGLRVEVADGHSIAASVSQGYKAPTTQDLFLDVGSGFVTDITTGNEVLDIEEVSNPDLDPERSTNYELSYLFQRGRTRIELTGFFTDYDEFIQNVSDAVPYAQPITVQEFSFATFTFVNVTRTEDAFVRAENVGAVELFGFELDGQFAFNDQWSVRFGYSHVEGEHKSSSLSQINGFQDGDDLVTASPDSALLSLRYQAPQGNWGGSANFVWTDGVDESTDASFTSLNNGEGPVHYPDSWTTLDLIGFYQFEQLGGLRLSVAVRNVWDEDYVRWEVINGVRPGNGGFFAGASGNGFERFSDPGRSVSVDLSLNF